MAAAKQFLDLDGMRRPRQRSGGEKARDEDANNGPLFARQLSRPYRASIVHSRVFGDQSLSTSSYYSFVLPEAAGTPSRPTGMCVPALAFCSHCMYLIMQPRRSDSTFAHVRGLAGGSYRSTAALSRNERANVAVDFRSISDKALNGACVTITKLTKKCFVPFFTFKRYLLHFTSSRGNRDVLNQAGQLSVSGIRLKTNMRLCCSLIFRCCYSCCFCLLIVVHLC